MLKYTKSIIIIILLFIIILTVIIDSCQRKNVNDVNNEQIKETSIDENMPIEMKSCVVPNDIEFESVFELSDYERWVVECMVMGESGGESYEGQVLVAQCILNACLKDGLHPSEVKNIYKYSGWNENPSGSVKSAVTVVFDNGYKITDEYILYFYAPKLCVSTWHESQKFVTEVGGHRFFAEWDDENYD